MKAIVAFSSSDVTTRTQQNSLQNICCLTLKPSYLREFLQFRGIVEFDLYNKWLNYSRNSVDDFPTRIAIVLHLQNAISYLET